MSRDWQLDMERCKDFTSMESKSVYIKALEYWLQQYAAEKERADKAERGEQKLKEAIELEIKHSLSELECFRAARLHKVLASLYPLPEREGEA